MGMQPMRRLSLAELSAEHLRERLQAGRWHAALPGVARLAAEMDVSRDPIRAARRLLEADGVLDARGLGRSRSIAVGSESGALRRPLRVAILRHDAHLADCPQPSLVLTEIMQSLDAAGHAAFFCKKSQIELKHEVWRLTRQLTETRADAWLVEAGSRTLLEWCVTQPTPCLALYGRTGNLPLARTGPDTAPAYRAATRHLLEHGHRRIVLIAREVRRKPTPGISERAFLGELAAHGVLTGGYNLPDWEETPKGFSRLLETLFQRTPPTALIIDEFPRFFCRGGVSRPVWHPRAGTGLTGFHRL